MSAHRMVAPLLLLALLLSGFALTPARPAQAKAHGATTLPNGVAAGDVTATSVVLWARSTAVGDLTFELSTAAIFSHLDCLTTAAVIDPEVPVKVTIDQLTPDTRYYYRVTDAAGSVATGTFSTAAAPRRPVGLRFGVSGDWRGELSPYPAIANAARRKLDFFVMHGDTIYADYPSPALPKPQAETLAEYRLKQSEVYGTRFGLNSFAQLRAATAVFATIDDHEVTNDFSGGAPCATDSRFTCPTPETLINDSQLYEDGLQAFQEYNPIADEFYGAVGDPRMDGERKLYRARTFGRDAAIFVIDTRSFRDPGLPAVADPTDPAQVAAYLAASFDPRRTLLGRQQMSDLKQDLLSAQQQGITWKFVMVPEPIQNLGVVGASDRFEGYAAERTELLGFIAANAITNVVFIAADIHGTVVNELTYQVPPRIGPGQPQLPTGAFEISTGSVAFDAPFGPTVVELAAAFNLLTPQQLAFYNSLPRTSKDAFVEALVNQQVVPLGYSPVGLDGSDIDTTLLAGSYVATHTFGWTEFEINRRTQALTVTTYGIDPYSEAELLADPAGVITRKPQVVSKFVVTPIGK